MQLTTLETYGAEIRGRYASEEGVLSLASLAYGYIKSNKQSAGYISKYALDYMRHKLAATVGIRFLRDCTLTLTGSLYDRNGEYIDSGGTTRPYAPYFLLDGRLAWQHGGWQLYLDTTNITSTRYFDFGGLVMPGTWVSVGIVVIVM
jgi:iron complex outermembrane receptor protein